MFLTLAGTIGAAILAVYFMLRRRLTSVDQKH
jgi:hypothetical protein